MKQTADLATARSWAEELLGENNSAKYYFAPENFVTAYRNGDSFTFLTVDNEEPENPRYYSQMYGDGAHFDERANFLSVASDKALIPGYMSHRQGFQFWEAPTSADFHQVLPGSRFEVLHDGDEINDLIDNHAPDSSVRPGDPETVFWGGIRKDNGELSALAVIVKWQSGFHVMASVLTRSSDRGKGFATQLATSVLNHASTLGISTIGLGVRTTNLAAQRAYEKAGFRKLAEFTNYSRE